MATPGGPRGRQPASHLPPALRRGAAPGPPLEASRHRLRRPCRGAGPGGTTDLYIAVLATLFAGAAYVPVDFEDPDERAMLAWQEADVCAVVEKGLAVTARRRGAARRGAPSVGDDCWVIFTSGSTGKPKGVVVTHRSAAAFVDAEATLWAVGEQDRVLAGLSIGFDASCEEMWLAWANGAALVAAPRDLVRSGADLGPWLAERRITVVSTVPSLASLWDERHLAGVRLLVLGGEACPPQLGWRLAAGREVWNTYGPTEATVVSTVAPILAERPITIGYPLRGWEVALVDEDGRPAAGGEPGEIVIAGVGLGRYLDPSLDTTRYSPLAALGWERAYRTGDMARETADGLEYLGRRDNQVKIGGRRIELGEIEAQLGVVPGVRAAVAAVRKTQAGNPVLVGYVVGEVDGVALRAQLADRLPAALVPRIVGLEALPLKRSGKVDRDALPWPPPGAGRRPAVPDGAKMEHAGVAGPGPAVSLARSPAQACGWPNGGRTSSARCRSAPIATSSSWGAHRSPLLASSRCCEAASRPWPWPTFTLTAAWVNWPTTSTTLPAAPTRRSQ